MFTFEKLEVYLKAKNYNHLIYQFVQKNTVLDRTTRDQFRRASFSIMLNIAEGSGRFSNADRRNFFVIARGSIFEYVAILDFLNSENLISKDLFESLINLSEELSKMIFTMIRNLENK